MLSTLRRRVTYANAMSTLAVFIALGGSSYAAITINGATIRDRSIPADKLQRNTLGGSEINESSLRQVASARNASRLGGHSAAAFKLRCPTDTFAIADVCVEKTARSASSYSGAVLQCAQVGGSAGSGRRLPTHGELRAALAAVELAPGGELTSTVYPSATDLGRLNVVYVIDKVGGVGVSPDTAAGAKAYRCVTDPLN